MLKEFLNGILAGLMISIGGSVFLAQGGYVGAILFSVALYVICLFGFSLFTGKIGFCAIDVNKKNFGLTGISLLSNFLGCLLFGVILHYGLPNLAEKSQAICLLKLNQQWYETLIRAFFCGVLMFIAVWLYRKKGAVLGIFICIPVFILSGFEHSIADMFYFAIAFSFNFETLLFILVVIVGNAIGGMFIPLIQRLADIKKAEKPCEVEGKDAKN